MTATDCASATGLVIKALIETDYRDFLHSAAEATPINGELSNGCCGPDSIMIVLWHVLPEEEASKVACAIFGADFGSLAAYQLAKSSTANCDYEFLSRLRAHLVAEEQRATGEQHTAGLTVYTAIHALEAYLQAIDRGEKPQWPDESVTQATLWAACRVLGRRLIVPVEANNSLTMWDGTDLDGNEPAVVAEGVLNGLFESGDNSSFLLSDSICSIRGNHLFFVQNVNNVHFRPMVVPLATATHLVASAADLSMLRHSAKFKLGAESSTWSAAVVQLDVIMPLHEDSPGWLHKLCRDLQSASSSSAGPLADGVRGWWESVRPQKGDSSNPCVAPLLDFIFNWLVAGRNHEPASLLQALQDAKSLLQSRCIGSHQLLEDAFDKLLTDKHVYEDAAADKDIWELLNEISADNKTPQPTQPASKRRALNPSSKQQLEYLIKDSLLTSLGVVLAEVLVNHTKFKKHADDSTLDIFDPTCVSEDLHAQERGRLLAAGVLTPQKKPGAFSVRDSVYKCFSKFLCGEAVEDLRVDMTPKASKPAKAPRSSAPNEEPADAAATDEATSAQEAAAPMETEEAAQDLPAKIPAKEVAAAPKKTRPPAHDAWAAPIRSMPAFQEAAKQFAQDNRALLELNAVGQAAPGATALRFNKHKKIAWVETSQAFFTRHAVESLLRDTVTAGEQASKGRGRAKANKTAAAADKILAELLQMDEGSAAERCKEVAAKLFRMLHGAAQTLLRSSRVSSVVGRADLRRLQRAHMGKPEQLKLMQERRLAQAESDKQMPAVKARADVLGRDTTMLATLEHSTAAVEDIRSNLLELALIASQGTAAAERSGLPTAGEARHAKLPPALAKLVQTTARTACLCLGSNPCVNRLADGVVTTILSETQQPYSADAYWAALSPHLPDAVDKEQARAALLAALNERAPSKVACPPAISASQRSLAAHPVVAAAAQTRQWRQACLQQHAGLQPFIKALIAADIFANTVALVEDAPTARGDTPIRGDTALVQTLRPLCEAVRAAVEDRQRAASGLAAEGTSSALLQLAAHYQAASAHISGLLDDAATEGQRRKASGGGGASVWSQAQRFASTFHEANAALERALEQMQPLYTSLPRLTAALLDRDEKKLDVRCAALQYDWARLLFVVQSRSMSKSVARQFAEEFACAHTDEARRGTVRAAVAEVGGALSAAAARTATTAAVSQLLLDVAAAARPATTLAGLGLAQVGLAVGGALACAELMAGPQARGSLITEVEGRLQEMRNSLASAGRFKTNESEEDVSPPIVNDPRLLALIRQRTVGRGQPAEDEDNGRSCGLPPALSSTVALEGPVAPGEACPARAMQHLASLHHQLSCHMEAIHSACAPPADIPATATKQPAGSDAGAHDFVAKLLQTLPVMQQHYELLCGPVSGLLGIEEHLALLEVAKANSYSCDCVSLEPHAESGALDAVMREAGHASLSGHQLHVARHLAVAGAPAQTGREEDALEAVGPWAKLCAMAAEMALRFTVVGTPLPSLNRDLLQLHPGTTPYQRIDAALEGPAMDQFVALCAATACLARSHECAPQQLTRNLMTCVLNSGDPAMVAHRVLRQPALLRTLTHNSKDLGDALDCTGPNWCGVAMPPQMGKSGVGEAIMTTHQHMRNPHTRRWGMWIAFNSEAMNNLETDPRDGKLRVLAPLRVVKDAKSLSDMYRVQIPGYLEALDAYLTNPARHPLPEPPCFVVYGDATSLTSEKNPRLSELMGAYKRAQIGVDPGPDFQEVRGDTPLRLRDQVLRMSMLLDEVDNICDAASSAPFIQSFLDRVAEDDGAFEQGATPLMERLLEHLQATMMPSSAATRKRGRSSGSTTTTDAEISAKARPKLLLALQVMLLQAQPEMVVDWARRGGAPEEDSDAPPDSDTPPDTEAPVPPSDCGGPYITFMSATLEATVEVMRHVCAMMPPLQRVTLDTTKARLKGFVLPDDLRPERFATWAPLGTKPGYLTDRGGFQRADVARPDSATPLQDDSARVLHTLLRLLRDDVWGALAQSTPPDDTPSAPAKKEADILSTLVGEEQFNAANGGVEMLVAIQHKNVMDDPLTNFCSTAGPLCMVLATMLDKRKNQLNLVLLSGLVHEQRKGSRRTSLLSCLSHALRFMHLVQQAARRVLSAPSAPHAAHYTTDGQSKAMTSAPRAAHLLYVAFKELFENGVLTRDHLARLMRPVACFNRAATPSATSGTTDYSGVADGARRLTNDIRRRWIRLSPVDGLPLILSASDVVAGAPVPASALFNDTVTYPDLSRRLMAAAHMDLGEDCAFFLGLSYAYYRGLSVPPRIDGKVVRTPVRMYVACSNDRKGSYLGQGMGRGEGRHLMEHWEQRAYTAESADQPPDLSQAHQVFVYTTVSAWTYHYTNMPVVQDMMRQMAEERHVATCVSQAARTLDIRVMTEGNKKTQRDLLGQLPVAEQSRVCPGADARTQQARQAQRDAQRRICSGADARTQPAGQVHEELKRLIAEANAAVMRDGTAAKLMDAARQHARASGDDRTAIAQQAVQLIADMKAAARELAGQIKDLEGLDELGPLTCQLRHVLALWDDADANQRWFIEDHRRGTHLVLVAGCLAWAANDEEAFNWEPSSMMELAGPIGHLAACLNIIMNGNALKNARDAGWYTGANSNIFVPHACIGALEALQHQWPKKA
ncbi:hypothetical protein HXX76_014120 [Chlamydomonas incerta]|uniref:Uncharacterized protein n=1 Tax=Chlamydomonas incerta TaxID=51695 RepID=A0A835VQ07_CHLIN|nr:hypothetical protein HXX76_014120 [Chlamydomonas incerta]|eukprot:KAG2424962.1 hypothetical protein HXX76_014120 [Chlamydomonas incerta]